MDFHELCIENRKLSANKGYYECPPSFDLIIRASEFINKKNKVWHKEYIKEHINEYSDDLLEIAFTNMEKSLAKDVRQFLEEMKKNN